MNGYAHPCLLLCLLWYFFSFWLARGRNQLRHWASSDPMALLTASEAGTRCMPWALLWGQGEGAAKVLCPSERLSWLFGDQ